MKKVIILSIYCLLYYYSSAQLTEAQRVGKLNIATENKTGELLSTDPLIGGKLHYKAVPYSLKKGMGAIFFMQSNAFIPLVFLSTPQGKEFGTPGSRASKEGQEATISFIATSDTSFYIVLVSAQENKTGPFTYGFRILNPDQMIFNKDLNACQKIDYLINHWQLNWELIPTKNGFYQDKDDPRDSYEYKYTDHTMAGEGLAKFIGGYHERIYTSIDSSSIKAKFYYDKFRLLIEACISPAVWSTQTEKKETKIGFVTKTDYITNFFLKGAKPDEAKKSFKIKYQVPLPVSEDFFVEVQLIFN